LGIKPQALRALLSLLKIYWKIVSTGSQGLPAIAGGLFCLGALKACFHKRTNRKARAAEGGKNSWIQNSLYWVLQTHHNMSLPEILPIARMEDYHTHFLGQSKDGRLFWGYETFAFTKPYSERQGKDWQKFRKEFAVLHTFDKEGNYIETTHWSDDGTVGPEMCSFKLEELVATLGDVEYKDIAIKLFKTTIDGIVFGLIPDIQNESIELQPSSTIAFQEPWDGEYCT
jgi:hypothetical protein